MHVAIGSDHAGFELKEAVKTFLTAEHHEVVDVGTHNQDLVDYPDYAQAVGTAVRESRAERGILLCGSGVGASMVANRIPGIRAGLCHDTYSAHQGVEHDNMNVPRARWARHRHRARPRAHSRIFERPLHGRASSPAPPRQADRAREPPARARGLRPVRVARLHPSQPDRKRRAAPLDRRRRRTRRHLQPGDLRKGRRR